MLGNGPNGVMALGLISAWLFVYCMSSAQVSDKCKDSGSKMYIFFNVLEVCRLPGCLDVPVHSLQPVVQHWVVVPDSAKIAFEVLDINDVEANQGRVQPDVQFSQVWTQQERPRCLGQKTFKSVECCKHGYHVLIIFLLRRGEPCLVNSRVQVSLHPGGDEVDLGAKIRRVKIDRIGRRDKLFESSWKPSKKFSALLSIAVFVNRPTPLPVECLNSRCKRLFPSFCPKVKVQSIYPCILGLL